VGELAATGVQVGLPVIFGRRWVSPPVPAAPGRSGIEAPAADREDSASVTAGPDEAWARDAALVERSKVDAEAFGLLYDAYCDQIFRFVARRLADRSAAEDVTAEVFFKALRGIDGYRPAAAPFSAWLHRIAANAVIDHQRARRLTDPLDAVAELSDRAASVEDQAVDRVEVDRVWAAVEDLTDAQRVAITLRLGEDLPIAQIAARMNRSEGAVKLLLNRGLSTLRAELDRANTPRHRCRATGQAGEERPR
jgi:RNA polymerase sigma-70 factor, ECF subfamily